MLLCSSKFFPEPQSHLLAGGTMVLTFSDHVPPVEHGPGRSLVLLHRVKACGLCWYLHCPSSDKGS